MITDPTQVPVELYPYGGGPPSPYGPYPGFWLGQRAITYEDADRLAKERAQATVLKSEISSDPKDKYITPEGRLNPGIAIALQKAKMAQQKPQDPLGSLQQKILLSVLLGSLLAALLK